ncbi:MAG TPA: hypothetical protein IAA38_03190 [Candidatus Ruminococcus gallistercoris]|nr:hypothetical protein [Candidatus Ruminococcus gallistercoris]
MESGEALQKAGARRFPKACRRRHRRNPEISGGIARFSSGRAGFCGVKHLSFTVEEMNPVRNNIRIRRGKVGKKALKRNNRRNKYTEFCKKNLRSTAKELQSFCKMHRAKHFWFLEISSLFN